MKTRLTKEQWAKLRYPIELRALGEDEGGGWLAHIPLLGKGLFMVDADTAAEAVEQLEALRLEMYETIIASGRPIPLPADTDEPAASGKWVQRTSPSIHGELRRLAAAEGVSLNSLCEQLLIRGMVSRQAEDAFAKLAEGVLEDMRFRIAQEARSARYRFAGLETSPGLGSVEEEDYESFFKERLAG